MDHFNHKFCDLLGTSYAPVSKILFVKACPKRFSYLLPCCPLKSVHFKNTTARSSDLSKLWSSADFVLISAQGRHGRFLAGKAAIVVVTSPGTPPLPLSNSQNSLACIIENDHNFDTLQIYTAGTNIRAATGGKAAKFWSLARFWGLESGDGRGGAAYRQSGHHYSCLACQKSTVATMGTVVIR